MLIRNSDIPGFGAAVKRENDVRDAAFLDFTTTIVPGIELRQMTPRDLLILDGLGNPLMSGELPSPRELVRFLWILQELKIENSKFKMFRMWRFARLVRKLNYVAIVSACQRYLADTFQDSPGGSGVSAVPFAGWCAHMVNTIAREYGWAEETILRTPLKRLFQYHRCVRKYHNPDAPMMNPSDKARREGVLQLHAARMNLLELLRQRRN